MKPLGGSVHFVLLVLAAGLASGQSQRPAPAEQREFDAVSIKPYEPKGPLWEGCNPRGDPGMFKRTGCSLEALVEQVYDVKPYQVLVKGPAWIGTDKYVVEARVAAPATKAEMLKILEPVLITRFGMAVHWETRDAPFYMLQVAKRGPRLKAATDTTKCGQIFFREGIVKADCVTIGDIREIVESVIVTDRPVADRTNLGKDAKYQIKLEFSSGDDPSAAPSIFSALPDQLGLTLKAGKAPLKMLVIDRAERPQPN